ncbi:MAG: phasin family protein [Rhodocyclaceae bacterium]|nr:phasin family protein [Rhodocyclaceae bacterium]
MATKKKVVGISELNRRNVEAAMKLARLSIDNSQRVLSLHSDLAKAIFEDTVANAKAHAKVRTPQELVALNTKYVQATAKRVVEVARKVSGIANQSRNEFSRVLQQQMIASKSELTEAVQALVKNLPAGMPDVNKSVEQAVAAANAAFEQLSQVSNNALTAVGVKKATPAAKAKAAVKKTTATVKKAVKAAPAKAKAAPAKAKAAVKPAVKKVAAAAKPVAAKAKAAVSAATAAVTPAA